MPLTITTLNNEAAASKTFTEIAKDKQTAEWINSTDSSVSKDSRLAVKQTLLPKNKMGQILRRTLVQHKISVPIAGGSEDIVVNLTLTMPVSATVATETDLKDAVAFIRNFVTGANVAAMRQGQV